MDKINKDEMKAVMKRLEPKQYFECPECKDIHAKLIEGLCINCYNHKVKQDDEKLKQEEKENEIGDYIKSSSYAGMFEEDE